jgi:glycosidase
MMCLQVLYSNFLPLNFLSNHDTARMATRLSTPAHHPLALTLLCTLRGMPCLYYGDELGLTGEKQVFVQKSRTTHQSSIVIIKSFEIHFKQEMTREK